MRLFTASRAPNPRRVLMFLAEKGIDGLERVEVDLNAQHHKRTDFLARNPMARVPVLELDDGRYLSESRAICTYLEGLQPAPNLMGTDATERAFIEMWDRRAEMYLLASIANVIRHTHLGLAPLEVPQFPEFGKAQVARVKDYARAFDAHLAHEEYVAGSRFTIADITAFCGLEFARGLMKFVPAQEGLSNLQAWRDRIAQRPSAKA